MVSKSAMLLLALSALAAATPATVEKREACGDVHLIIARASTEAPGDGIIGSVGDDIVSGSKQTVTRESVDYPALLDPYADSSAQGTAALIRQLTSFVNRCSTAKVALLGYSQGAHIIGDTLCGGGGGTLGAETAAIASSYSGQVVAVVQMGDPRHTRSETYHVGTSLDQGLFPRLTKQSCEKFASIWKSYCDYGDTFCDSGINVEAHLLYVTIYGSNAKNFVLDKIGG